MIEKYVDMFLEVGTIKDRDGYSLGTYDNGVARCGIYLRAKKGTILERVEVMAKGKFKLEQDSENYAQESRVIFFQKLKDYLEKNGEPSTNEEMEIMYGKIFESCRNALSDIAMRSTSNAVIYNRKEKSYSIMNLMSLDITEEEGVRTLEAEVEDALTNSQRQSYSSFRIWFNKNKDKILTSKQLQYINREVNIDRKNIPHINKRIAQRVEDYMVREQLKDREESTVKRKLRAVERILDCKNKEKMAQQLCITLPKNSWLEQELFSLSLEVCSEISKTIKEGKVHITKKGWYEIIGKLVEIEQYYTNKKENLQ